MEEGKRCSVLKYRYAVVYIYGFIHNIVHKIYNTGWVVSAILVTMTLTWYIQLSMKCSKFLKLQCQMGRIGLEHRITVNG